MRTIEDRTKAAFDNAGLVAQFDVVVNPQWTGWHITLGDGTYDIDDTTDSTFECFPTISKPVEKVSDGDLSMVATQAKAAFKALVGTG